MRVPNAIFELGLNHMGDVDRARRMVDALAIQGATHMTIQAATDFTTTTRDANAIQAVQPNCLSLEDVIAVVKYGNSKGLQVGVAVLDPMHIDSFVRAGAQFFKVLSSDLTYSQLHKAIVKTGLPCYLSTGLATTEDIERALTLLYTDFPTADVRLIHTVLQVPTPTAQLNLSRITLLRTTFAIPVAFGQHSDEHDALPVAIAAGAETVFVYVAENPSPQLPDGPHAVLCSNIAALLQTIDRVRVMMGEGQRALNPDEQERRISLRRSIVAATFIRKGEVITAEKVAYKRPGTGCAPWDAARVLGSVAVKDYVQDEDILDP
jgi:sialic acid synthase SpsE